MRMLLAATALLATAACSMNPQMAIPPAPVPAAFPGVSAAASSSVAEIEWRAMFRDPRLQRIIELALDNNRDLRIAALNVEAARSSFRVARGAQLPAIDASGNYTRQRLPRETASAGLGGAEPGSTPPMGNGGIEFGQFSANVALTSFEIDLFGRLRSQSQAAFARYLASDEGRRATRVALIGSVVDAYLAERLASEQLELTEQTLADWKVSLRIAQALHGAQQASGLEIAQAEGLVRQAEADLAARERELLEAKNALQLLVGVPLPDDLPAPIGLIDQPMTTQLPVGLPSDIIATRPDIRQAERELAAANADVGAARAAFFPRLSLTGLLGFTSLELDDLFSGSSRNWSFSPQITQPIFRGGALRAELRLAEVRKSVAVAQYERAIQAAFREVSDGLAGRATFARQVQAQQHALEAAVRRRSISDMRYRAGIDSRLELLDAQRSEYGAKRELLETRRQELSSAVGLYRSLGGGDDHSSGS